MAPVDQHAPGGGAAVMVVARPSTVSTEIRTAATCPFAALDMGEAQIEQYLSDARDRLRRGEPWQLNTTQHLEAIALKHAKSDPNLMVMLTALDTRVKQDIGHQVVQFRNRIFQFAATLVECITFSTSGRADIAEQCFSELEILDVEITEQFEGYHKVLSELVCSFNAEVAEHMERSVEAARGSEWSTVATGMGVVSACVGSIMPVVGVVRPELLLSSGLSREIFAPTHKSSTGIVHYSSKAQGVKLNGKWALGLLAAGTLGTALATYSRWRSQHLSKVAEREEMLAKAKALHAKFVQQDNEMWRGMFMWVEDVERSIKRLRSLHIDRVDARNALMRDIAWKLFGMSMAVDEYIFWLNGHNKFPANFSIRNLITPGRYDRIASLVNTNSFQAISDDAEKQQQKLQQLQDSA